MLRLLPSADADELASVIRGVLPSYDRPLIISIDGRSGTGKSTLARQLATNLSALVLEGDDFYCGGIDIRHDSVEKRAADCIDLDHLAELLVRLRQSEAAAYHPFDWDAFDGSLAEREIRLQPHDVIIVEGVYTSSPVLGDVIDLRIKLEVPDHVRIARLRQREGEIGPWELQWHEAEEYYFSRIATSDTFDFIIDSEPKEDAEPK